MMDMGLPAAALTPVFRRGLLATGMAIIVAASGAQAQVSATGMPTREGIEPSRRPPVTPPSRLTVGGELERSPGPAGAPPARVGPVGSVNCFAHDGGRQCVEGCHLS